LADWQEQKKKFRIYWKSLSEKPTERKDDGLECQGCNTCHVIWPDFGCITDSHNNHVGIIAKYDAAFSRGELDLAAKIARNISELPWRDKNETVL
jgi:hypothetical protein